MGESEREEGKAARSHVCIYVREYEGKRSFGSRGSGRV